MSVIVKNLTYIYDEGMPFASKAIDDIYFEIKDNDFVGLIGHTGSGKSTTLYSILQELNKDEINISTLEIQSKQ